MTIPPEGDGTAPVELVEDLVDDVVDEVDGGGGGRGVDVDVGGGGGGSAVVVTGGGWLRGHPQTPKLGWQSNLGEQCSIASPQKPH